MSKPPPPPLTGEFYLGCDLGKKHDYSVVAVLRRDTDAFRLVFLKQFKLATEYGAVIGYIKVLSERLRGVACVTVDQTGSEYFVEDLQKVMKVPVQGVMLTLPAKQEILGYMKRQMEDGKLLIPYDQDLIAEANSEKFELTKTGQIQFSHPPPTHDDRLWALALALWGSKTPIDRSRPILRSF